MPDDCLHSILVKIVTPFGLSLSQVVTYDIGNQTMKILLPSLIFAVVLLQACGGGGGGGGTPTTSASCPAAQSPVGLWSGTTTVLDSRNGVESRAAYATKLAILQSGEFYQFFGDAQAQGQTYGTATVDQCNQLVYGSFKGKINTTQQNQSTYGDITSTALAAGKSLQFSTTKQYPMFNQTITTTHALTYDTTFGVPLQLADVAGSYVITAYSNDTLLPSTMTISPTGVIAGDLNYFSGLAFSCKFSGTVSPNTQLRYANVQIDIPQLGCPWALAGAGKLILETYSGKQRIRIGSQSGGNELGVTIYAERQ